VRSAPGTAEAVYECGRQPRVRGRRAARADQLPELRQPREAPRRLAADRGSGRPAEACNELGIPVVGGTCRCTTRPQRADLPTPVVGIVGKLPDAARAGRLGFLHEGDAIALVGRFEPSLAGSELEKLRGDAPVGALPFKDVQAVRDARVAVRDAVRSRALHSAHDVAEGGLAVALAECCVAGGIGARVRLPEGTPVRRGARVRLPGLGSSGHLRGARAVIGRVDGARLEIVGGARSRSFRAAAGARARLAEWV